MKILCVHQNFPGQFRDIAPALINRGHDVRAICSHNKEINMRTKVNRYIFEKKDQSGIHPLTTEVDEWIRRSELAAKQASKFKEEKWAPDVILGHPGWGETLLLKTIYPSSAIVLWPELWIRPEQMGVSVNNMNIEQWNYLKCKNGLVELAISEASLVIVPTSYQANSFPEKLRNKMIILHEGVQDDLFKRKRIKTLSIGEKVHLDADIPVVTFISRNLEPMRGFHAFMRALPSLQEKNKKVNIVIVGGDEVSYSNKAGDGKCWREIMIEELRERIDMDRIHFVPRLKYDELVKLYLRSNLHVYLSNEFVLSWSLTEIMGCGTPVLAYSNEMMKEIIKPGSTGALYKGTDEGLGEAINSLLEQPGLLLKWGNNARDYIRKKYSSTDTIIELEKHLEKLKMIF